MVINCPLSIIYCCRQPEKKSLLFRWRAASLVSSLPSNTLFKTHRSLMGINAQSNAATGPPVFYGSWWTHISDRVMRGGRRLPFSLNLGDLVKIWKQYSGLSVAKAEAVVPRKEMGSKKIIQLLKRNGCDTEFHFDADCKQRRKKKKAHLKQSLMICLCLCFV